MFKSRLTTNYKLQTTIFLLAVLAMGMAVPQNVSAASYNIRDFTFQVDLVNQNQNVLNIVLEDDSTPQIPIGVRITLTQPQLAAGDSQIGDGDTIQIPQEWATDGSAETAGFYMSMIRESLYNEACGETQIPFVLTDYTTCSETDYDTLDENGNTSLPLLTPGQERQHLLYLTKTQVQGWAEESAEVGQQKLDEGGWYYKVYINPWVELHKNILPVRDAMFIGDSKWIAVRVFDTQEEFEEASPLAQNNLPPSDPGTSGFVQGQGLFDFIGGGIVSVVNVILGVIISVLRWIVWIAGTLIFVPILETTLTINAAEITEPIRVGWEYVRDIVNMFFILILIIIGFATMLRLESYNYRKLLVSLIIMALLVNFSLVIGRIIIQIADTAQFSFLPATVEQAGEDGITASSGVRHLFDRIINWNVNSVMTGLDGFTSSTSGALATTFSLIFQFILELGVILTFGAMAVFMLIRTVGLWILLILSPLAYVFNILPATKGIAKRWWSNFLKYAFFAPILAFFLRLSAHIYEFGLILVPNFDSQATGTGVGAISQPKNLTDYITKFGGTIGVDGLPGATMGQTLQLLMVYILIIAFLWAGLLATRSMGIFGANAVVGMASRGLAAPFAIAGRGVKGGIGGLVGFGGRTYSKAITKRLKDAQERGAKGKAAMYQALGMLRPTVAKKAWKERSEEKEREATMPAAGYARDTLNRFMPTEWKWKRDETGKKTGIALGQKTPYGRIGENKLIAEKTKILTEADLSATEQAQVYHDASSGEDKQAAFRNLMMNRNENDMVMYAKRMKYNKELENRTQEMMSKDPSLKREEAEQIVKSQLDDDPEFQVTYSTGEEFDYFKKDMEQMGYGSEQIGRMLARHSDIGERIQNGRAVGAAVEDEPGVFRAANDFSGYQKMEEEKGASAMLEALDKTDIFDKVNKRVTRVQDRNPDGTLKVDSTGAAVMRDIEVYNSIEFKGKKIENYQDLQKAIESTKKGDIDKEENLHVELTGARKAASAKGRIDRGSASKWMGRFEPGAFSKMDSQGNILGFSSSGKKLYKALSGQYVDVVGRVRDFEPRALRTLGINKKDDGGVEYDDKVMAQAFRLNKGLTKAIISKKAGLTDNQKTDIQTIMTRELAPEIARGEITSDDLKL